MTLREEKKKFTMTRKTKNKEQVTTEIERNIEISMKTNPNDIINPLELGLKNSLFFRVHVSGIIESANVSFNIT
jgi:hypothetical protein